MTYTETSNHTRVNLNGRLNEFREALEDEIKQIEKSGLSSTLLSSGRRINSPGAEFWYRFRVEYLPVIPADTPCNLIIGTDQYEVTVVSFEEKYVIITSSIQLPDIIAKARLENGATILMKRLIDRIELNANKKNNAGNRMFATKDSTETKGFSRLDNHLDLDIEATDHVLNEEQKSAVMSAVNNDITYIWGPPGTGKTEMIAEIMNHFIRLKRTVLLVSHTNTAVDGAIKKVDEKYYENLTSKSNEDPYPILRLGKSTSLKGRVILESHIKSLAKELHAKKEELEKEKANLEIRVSEITQQINKVRWVKENRLYQLDDLASESKTIETELQKLNDEKVRIESELQDARFQSNHYDDFEMIQINLNQKEQEFVNLEKRVAGLKSELLLLPEKIQAANDELVQYMKYKDLKAIEANQFSIPNQKSRIKSMKEQVNEWEEKERVLFRSRGEYQQRIDEYENMNLLMKRLKRKAAGKLVDEIKVVRNNLSETQTMLTVKRNALKELEEQLIKSLINHEQMNLFIFTDSEDNLRTKFSKMSESLNQKKRLLPTLEVQLEDFKQEINNLRNEYKQLKLICDQLMEIKKTLHEIKSKISQKRNRHSGLDNEYKSILYQECDFWFPLAYGKDPIELKIELEILLLDTTKEVEHLDLQDLLNEQEVMKGRISKSTEEILEIEREMTGLEKKAIIDAKIIGTTLVQSYLNDIIQARSFDTVIVDEASMASIPALWCASYLAEKNIVIVGDFKQLPPIVIADTQMALKWLGKDIFLHSGMQDRIGKNIKPPNNFIVLDKQFRMEKQIADIANIYYKEQGVELISNDDHPNRKIKREEFNSWYNREEENSSVNLIDTGSLNAWVTGVPQGKKHSRLNIFSATLCVELAFSLIEKKLEEYRKANEGRIDDIKSSDIEIVKPCVLIVAPYKPHVAKLQQLINFEYRSRDMSEDLNFISVGTIHRFQGNEADIVIFDLVVDEPHWKANLFMPDKKVGDSLKKMYNVAITRARFKLFVVGNFSYCIKRAGHNALATLINHLKIFPKFDARELFPYLNFTRSEIFLPEGTLEDAKLICKEDTFYNYFLHDIKNSEKQLIIYSPFITQDRLTILLPYFVDAINRKCEIIVVTKSLTDRKKTENSYYKKCEEQLRIIGVKIIHKKGMHEKIIFIDSKTTWIGSLNALSNNGLTGEIMQRYHDEELFSQYYKLLDIEHIVEVSQNEEEQKCPICKGEMLAAESDKGGFYWTCENKDYSRQTKQQYPSDGVLRCTCGASFKFSMKKQPRWVCTADKSHYQKMRKNDLKLVKMLALIPEGDQNKVRNYFSPEGVNNEQLTF